MLSSEVFQGNWATCKQRAPATLRRYSLAESRSPETKDLANPKCRRSPGQVSGTRRQTGAAGYKHSGLGRLSRLWFPLTHTNTDPAGHRDVQKSQETDQSVTERFNKSCPQRYWNEPQVKAVMDK